MLVVVDCDVIVEESDVIKFVFFDLVECLNNLEEDCIYLDLSVG